MNKRIAVEPARSGLRMAQHLAMIKPTHPENRFPICPELL